MKVEYDHGVKWAYEHTSDALANLEYLLKTVISAELEDVTTEIKMYRMTINDSNLPIHPCKHIITRSTSKWSIKEEIATPLLKF